MWMVFEDFKKIPAPGEKVCKNDDHADHLEERDQTLEDIDFHEHI